MESKTTRTTLVIILAAILLTGQGCATAQPTTGIKLPEKDREGQPIIFDSYDMSPVLLGTGKCARTEWFYFTENELSPGGARVGNCKAVFNLRGDGGAQTGGLAVDSNHGWKGAASLLPRCRKCSISDRTRRSATTCS